jgi:type VI secretion system protein ImpF
MPELPTMEKIQPCLLDRLTDNAPEKRDEASHERVVSISRYRDGVLRDLRWLLSASRHGDQEDLQSYPAIRSSTLNYGIRSLCGRSSESTGGGSLEDDITHAVEMFEPRIMPDSLTVEMKAETGSKNKNELLIEIRGDLWARPMPEEFLIKTKIDLETGELKML